MPQLPQLHSGGSARDSQFRNTLWSLVYVAGGVDSPNSRQALEVLCRTYWKPIYTFLRQTGHDHDKARDFTQGFFAYLFEKGLIQTVHSERGRFRSFLLGTLKNFISNCNQKEWAEKRGGRAEVISIDQEINEDGPFIQLATHLTPDREFDRRWALEVIEQGLQRLKTEYERAGFGELFAALQPFLSGDNTVSYRDLAKRLDKTEEALRVQVNRLRRRYRDFMRAVIADTLSDLTQLEEELEHFKKVLRES